MSDNFLFKPYRPVILKKTFSTKNQSKERIFLFYSSEEKGGESLKEYHRFTIYFCELTAKDQDGVIFGMTKAPMISAGDSKARDSFDAPDGIARAPFQPRNHYSIFIKGQKDACVQPWDKNISTEYPQKETDKDKKSVGLDFFITPQSCGLGSLILNHLIYWGQTLYPESGIKALSLSSVDERNEENKKRRDKLYSNIGLINYSGLKTLSELTPRLNSSGFQVIDVHEYLNSTLLNESNLQRSLREMQSKNKCLQQTIGTLEKENTSLKNKKFFKKMVTFVLIPICIVLYFYFAYAKV